MKRHLLAGLTGLTLLGAVGFAIAQTPLVPQVSIINSGDLFQDVVNGAPVVGNQYASASLLAGYTRSVAMSNNVLVGGDATTNLFQRGTTGASETTTYAYGGPDRWAYWSGTATAMTVSRDSTAADLPASGYEYGFKMARTSGQTGVVQVCMAQEVETVNSYQFQGQTAELDFHATAGANFSAASSNMTAYIVTGTGTDEGMQKLAYGLNGGGGGSSGWTGQANATAAVIPISTNNTRYAAVATIPTGATEIAGVLCFTPVGTAGANDYIAFAGIALVRNPALAPNVSTTVGYNCSSILCTSFERRPQEIETALQQRYYYSVAESVTSGTQQSSAGNGATTTTCQLFFPFPVNMRAAPTFAATVTTSTWTITHIATATALSSSGLAVLGANTVNGGSITATVASGLTTGQTCVLTSANGGGTITWSAEL